MGGPRGAGLARARSVAGGRVAGDLAQRDGQAGGGAAVAHSAEEVEEEALQRGVADAVRTVRADQAAARPRAAVRRNGGAGVEKVRGEGGAVAAAAARAYEVRCAPKCECGGHGSRRGRSATWARNLKGTRPPLHQPTVQQTLSPMATRTI